MIFSHLELGDFSYLEPGDVFLEKVVRHAAQVLADRLLRPHCNPHLRTFDLVGSFFFNLL